MGMFLRRGYAPHRTRMSDLEIGQTVKLNVNGKAWDWLVVHQGLPSSIYDASCDGTWLLMKDIYENRQWNSSDVNKYESSTIHSYLNGDFLNLFDSNVKDAIKQVKIPYRKNGGSGGIAQNGANGLLCRIFLLSGPEVGLAGEHYMSNDGAKLSYFNAIIGEDSKRIAYLNGSAANWYLRSVNTANSYTAWIINGKGSCFDSYVSYEKGIRPALIFSPTFKITEDMLV